MSFPLRADFYELIPGSSENGKYRRGLGARRAWTVLENNAQASICMEGTKSPAFGILGGNSGSLGRATLHYPDGSFKILKGKGAFKIPAERQVLIEAPGSGGYGNPKARSSSAI